MKKKWTKKKPEKQKISLEISTTPEQAISLEKSLPVVLKYITADQVANLAGYLNNPLTRQTALNALNALAQNL